MGLLSAALLAKLQSGGRCAWLLELGLPGGTKKYSKGGYDSLGGGWYEDRVQSWGGRVPRALSDPRSGAVPAVTTSVKLIDHDFALAKIIEGVGRDSVYGSTATIKLAEASVSSADWFTFFAGILTSWDPKDRVFNLSLRTDDLPLDRYHSAPLTQADWPGAASATWGQEAPRLYGRHSSFGATSGGMIPALPVDAARHRYLVCAGWAKAVDRVYVAGVEVTTGWTVDHPVVNGRLYTVITFDTDIAHATDPTSKPVTVDARGYETVGDGSGTLIENPVDQIVHAANNWVYHQYKTGNWLTGAPINAAAATSCAAYFTRKGFKGSGYIKDRVRGHDLIASWLKTWEARGWWTNSGQLAFGIEDHVPAAIYPTTLYREDRHDLAGSFKLDYEDAFISGVNVKHMFSATLGSFIQSLTVKDPRVTREAEEALDMPWSYASPA